MYNMDRSVSYLGLILTKVGRYQRVNQKTVYWRTGNNNGQKKRDRNYQWGPVKNENSNNACICGVLKWITRNTTLLHFNKKIVERGQIEATNTQIHDRSLFWLGTDTSIKSGGVKLVLLVKTFLLMECCGHASAFHVWEKCQPSHKTYASMTWLIATDAIFTPLKLLWWRKYINNILSYWLFLLQRHIVSKVLLQQTTVKTQSKHIKLSNSC